MIGQTLDERYAILRLVGKGGMGAVYEARNVRTNRRVAVKVISGVMDQDHIARFQREASIVGAVESQHLTLIYDTGYDRQARLPYIAMELLDGEDAAALLDRLGPLPVDLALRITYQACLGLGRAHQAGIVHRDIKAANLFLHRREGHERLVKILDFGIARVSGGETANHALTQTGTVLGSPLYMSPEQAKGGHVDARSDVWSLGVTLYEMLTGATPFVDIQQFGALIVAICTQPVPSLVSKAPHVPAPIAAIVHRALSIDPAMRFHSAAEMGEAIRVHLPHGYQIEDSMLRSQGDSSAIAPSLGLVASAPAFGTSSVASGGPIAHAQSGVVGPVVQGTTGIDTSQVASRPSSRLGLFAGIFALLCIAGVGGALWFGKGSSVEGASRSGGKENGVDNGEPLPQVSPSLAASSAPSPVVSTEPTSAAPIAKASASAAASASLPVATTVKTANKPILKRPSKDDETSRK